MIKLIVVILCLIFISSVLDSIVSFNSDTQKSSSPSKNVQAKRALDPEQPPEVRVGNTIRSKSQMWVTASTLFRRTCPSVKCGIVGKFFYRESVIVFEKKNEWGRVSEYYDASCSGGHSEYVDSGPANCTEDNGIKEGKFAEWMKLSFLSKKRPPEPAARAAGTAKLISGSDDYRRYKNEFIRAAETVIASKRCSAKEILGNGGWIKSSNKGKGIYFTWCNSLSDRVYLDVFSGRIF